MIKLSLRLKILFLFCSLASFVFLVAGFNKNNEVQYVEAAEMSCKGPADVMLVIDRSGTMGNDSKFTSTKSASAGFVDKLFSAEPTTNFPLNYHQIGLIAFNQNIDTKKLNQDGSVIKGYMNDANGILGEDSGYPVGSRNTATAIQQARLKMDLAEGGNPYATKTMIVLTDGVPTDLDAAKVQADTAKNEDNNIRIVSVGLKLDKITDETTRGKAKDFIKYISSSPADCYYVYDSGEALDNCTSINASELGTALEGVYNSITAAVCDENDPTISISKKPSGTLYNVDNLKITSTAIDDVGFKEHIIVWDSNNVECADLSGITVACSTGECVKISCDTGDLGPFDINKTIIYRSAAIDANDNSVNIDPPRTVAVANVDLSVPFLYRNKNNTITVDISNYVYVAEDVISISIDAPVLGEGGIEIDKAAMTCSSSGACVYNFNTKNYGDGCLDWTDGIADGKANNINVDIYIYADSNDMGIRQIALSENNLLSSYYEGNSWSGTCTDNLNNDCDYKDNNPLKPIIDLNPDGLDEALCDIAGPDIGISRAPAGDVYDDDLITFTSNATDDNGIKQHIIYYRENSGTWQTIPDSDSASISGTIGPLLPGVVIEYYSWAMDYSGNDNENSAAMESFIVKNRECEGRNNLDPCEVSDGQCCDGVCNTSAVNSGPFGSYNTDFCAELSCDGTVLEWVPNFFTGQCSESGESDSCYSYTPDPLISPFSPPDPYDNNGCEKREYRCDSGYCNYGVGGTRRTDSCDVFGPNPLIWRDFQCELGECVKIREWEDERCDKIISFSDLVVVDSSGTNITGKPEVLDSKTDKIKITAHVADPNGILNYKIYWQLNGGSWQEKDCGSCGPSTEATACSCFQEIGPFGHDDFINYYMWSQDNSPNLNEEYVGFDGGLNYDYYTYSSGGTDRKGTFKGSGIDTNPDHYWGGEIEINVDNIWEDQGNAAMTWKGFIMPDVLGEYKIYAQSDDGIKVYINGVEIINYWGYVYNPHIGTYTFTSLNPVPIKIIWYDSGGPGRMRLGWLPPGETTEVYPIPAANLIAPYALAVRDSECYDINFNYTLSVNKDDIETLCDLDNGNDPDHGICCGGYCDSTPSSTSYHEKCHVNSCSGTNWVYAVSNVLGDTKEGDSCGSTDTCFDYYSPNISSYSGCITGGNECSVGYCTTLSTITSVPACSGNLLTNYDCNPDNETGSCQAKDSNIDCSAIEYGGVPNYDNDTVACNCDCNNYDIEEKIYSSLKFDGADDYVSIPNDTIFDTTNLTISAWVNFADNSPSFIFEKGNVNTQYSLFSHGTDIVFRTKPVGGSYDTLSITKTSAGIINNQWHHIVGTYDGAVKKLYVDGDEKLSRDWVKTIETNNNGSSIGRFGGTTTGYYFTGSIDDVRIYNRALYPEEVKDHYNGIFADDTDLVGHWDFDEGTGEIAEDNSGNGNDGSLSNVDGKLYNMDNSDWVSGKYGNGLDFDGSNDYVDCGNDIISTGAYTKTVWFKRRAGNNYNNLISGYSYNAFWVHYGYNFKLSAGHNSTWDIVQDPISTEPDVWYFGAVTFDPAVNSGTMKLYKNDVEVDSATSVATQLLDTKTYISAYRANYHFNGQIDEVRIYNRALSTEEIAEHYNGIFADDTNLVGHWDFNEESGDIAEDSSENGPQWMKHYHGSVSGTGGNVPENWQACTDGKDNDCDGDTVAEKDEYDTGLGVSVCDGEVDAVSVTATANKACVYDAEDPCAGPTDLTDLLDASANNHIEIFDINIKDAINDFTITAGASDDFLIQQTRVEWTVDNWGATGSKTCLGAGICVTHVGEGSDEISSSLLSADNVFKFKVCAVDNSVNNNQKCTDEYAIEILSSNAVPVITPLSVIEPNFCLEGLEYILDWEFEDDGADAQASYEIQIKEDTGSFTDTSELIVNAEKNLSSSYYQILNTDFINDMEYDKIYDWRVKVTDDRGGGYKQTTDWEEGPPFTTPLYEFPQVDFSADPDYSENCLYEIDDTGGNVCDYGENITFYDNSTFIECIDPDNKECLTAVAAKCDLDNNICAPCEGNFECQKFNSGGTNYSCNIGNGICETSDSCGIDNDCEAADFARCDIDPDTGIGLCAACDNDLQCTNDKFDTTGIDYFCNNEGVCEDKEHRKWWFYSDDSLDVDSRDPNPINNYIESELSDYNVILKIKDIIGNSCFRKKRIDLEIEKYPKWNETFSSNN